VTLAAVGALVVGLALGLLGGGGTILIVPLLVYGMGLGAHEAIAVSLIVVAATAATSLLAHARAGHVQWRTGLVFGAGAMVGAYGGGLVGARLPGTVLLLAFAAMMIVTALAMLRGSVRAVGPHAPTEPGSLPLAKVIAEGLAVGAITGLVGAGGGFLVVPALVLLGGLSMRDAVGTSLLVVALKSAAGAVGYLGQVSVDGTLVLTMVGLAAAGSLVGARLAHRIAPNALRRAFAIFVLVMAVAIVAAELLG
jgi:hypothetical protein